MRSTRRWALGLALLAIVGLVALRVGLRKAPKRGPVRVLADQDHPFHSGWAPPWSGPDVELLTELTRRAGRAVEFVPLDSMPDLVAGMPDLGTISVLLDVDESVATRLGYSVRPGLRLPRPGILLHPKGRRPDEGPRPVVTLVRNAGYAGWARQAIGPDYEVREVRSRSEADRLFDPNRKVGIFLYPEVDGIALSEEQARERMRRDDKLRFFPLEGSPPPVPIAFASDETQLAETYQEMVASLAARGEVDRFVRLPPPPVEVDQASEGFSLDAILDLPYRPVSDFAGLACTRGSLWAAYDQSLYRIPLDPEGFPRTAEATAFPLSGREGQSASGLAFDGRDGLWVGYSGWPELQLYGPLESPTLVKTVSLGRWVMQYGLARHDNRFHIVGYTGESISFDIAAPEATWSSRKLDRVLTGLESRAGRLYATQSRGLVVLEEGRIVEIPLRGDLGTMAAFEGLAFGPETGLLYVVTREKLLRFVGGDRVLTVRREEASPSPDLSPPPAAPRPAGVLSEVDSVSFPGEPVALMRLGPGWLAASRTSPWGMMRMRQQGPALIVEERLLEKRPVKGLAALDGMIVAAAESPDGAPAGPPRLLILDPAAGFRQVSGASIPQSVSGLAAAPERDRIWGCTRANTVDSPEDAIYYSFDRNLRLLDASKAGNRGCQGLSWNGSQLFAVDVFADTLLLLDPDKGFEALGSWELPILYPSAVVAEGEFIHVADYQTRRIHRFRNPVPVSK